MRLSPAERRRSPRIHLQIPLFVKGFEESGKEFVELAKTIDISSTGACLVSRRFMSTDQLIYMTVPVSSEHVSGLIPSETSPIRGRVRRVRPVGEIHLVGVEFLKALT